VVVKELFTLLGFKVDQSGAKQYEEVFNRIKGLAIKIGAAIGLTELAKSIIETTSAWQQQNLQLSYIIGNTEKAHALMLRLNDLAGRSPFTTEELAGYAKQLINFGFSVDEITPLMSRLSNIAAVLGTDKIPLITEALARMKTKGYADARVMMELFHAGIPIQDELAKRFGVSTFQMNRLIQEGRVGFRDVYEALSQLTTGTGKFAGANEAYSRTLAGRWKSVLSIIDDLKKTLGTTLLPVIEQLITAFRDWLDVNKGHLADDMIKLLNTIAYVLGWIVGRTKELLASLGLLPDPNRTKEVSVVPGQQVKTGIDFIDRVQAASAPKIAPPLTHQMIEAAKAADKARIDRALTINNTNNLNLVGFTGDNAAQRNLQKLMEEATAEGIKKAIRQTAPNFAGATQ
jgi:tape measure domain-containing protein